MTTITLKIKENSKQAKLFVEYAKSLSFVEFVETDVAKPIKKDQTKNPNTLTLKTFSDTEKGLGITETKSHEDLMNKLFS